MSSGRWVGKGLRVGRGRSCKSWGSLVGLSREGYDLTFMFKGLLCLLGGNRLEWGSRSRSPTRRPAVAQGRWWGGECSGAGKQMDSALPAR